MTERPSWGEYFIAIARVVATRGTCERLQVGAVMVDPNNRLIAMGYNGAPRLMPHCPGQEQCVVEINGRKSCARALHAESNAIDQAGDRSRGCTLYITHFPCYDCSKRLINAGIERVVYSAEYTGGRSIPNAMDLLVEAGVKVFRQE